MIEPMRGINPDMLGDELLEMIAADIEGQPRSLQKEIGPSEVGSPCPRKVGYGLLQHPKLNTVSLPKLKAYIGQGAHVLLADMLDRYNLAHAADWGYQERFYVETELQVGEILGEPLIGHCDVYDRLTCTVIDWKTVGPTMLKDYRANGPGPQYRTQAHLYGRGWAIQGLPVDQVMLVFIPRQGELKDSYVWHEPYNERVADDALTRASGIKSVIDVLGGNVALGKLKAVEDHCGDCDWFVPHEPTGNFLNGCPGQLPEVKPAAPAITFVGGTQ